MKQLRSLVHLIAALVLLMQGVAVAAGPRAVVNAHEGRSPTSVGAHCHGADANGGGGAIGQASCCDAGCPDMLACAFSALATPPLAADLSLRPMRCGARPDPAAQPGAAFSRPSFRPPISAAA